MSMEKDKIKIQDMVKFSEGFKEFVESISKCPECAVRLGLELLEQDTPNYEEERKILRQILVNLGKTLVKKREYEETQKISTKGYTRLPIIDAWIRGEVGLGIIAKLIQE